MKANMVLKYLRWRNTDARGECAPGFDGEAFDLDPPSTMPEIPLWVPVEHGQGGNWSTDRLCEWFWRDWLAALPLPILENIIQRRAHVGDRMWAYGGFGGSLSWNVRSIMGVLGSSVTCVGG